ncbi:MAG: UDP-N-acetylmuramoyl-tripeptide--D-alanyl-D-alanine ligase [Spirochaetaceae bacterium]|jgi:UDP-N-acetylmuramoyl-tripeptide--D-alanyl-D-alanine ligase|nr:UDP-N-acetylmuramoyl-tripeptide--D-alanyl-D-alanine ligase [Spirochaetaceae bacterium]
MLMTFAEAAALPFFKILPSEDETPAYRGFDSVCADSREAAPGALFFALPGERSDGHAFVRDAFRAGAAGAVVDVSKTGVFAVAEAVDEAVRRRGTRPVLLEARTGIGQLALLQALAAAYIDRFPSLLRIGITGSSGKTTTKELTAAMIGAERSVAFNSGNLNSDSGLPLSLFRVRAEHRIGVFEMGMNRKGEIAELAAVLRPQIALVTNTGSAHIGLIGSERGIALEKKSVFSRFTGKELAILPESGPFAEFLAEGVNGRLVRFGRTASKKFGGAESKGLYGSVIVWNGVKADFALPGGHNLLNALAAAAVAEAAGASDEAVRTGLASAKPLFGRGEIVSILDGDVTVVRDCYNANPDSMEQAVSLCDEADWNGRRLYVIGSMLELGGDSERAHGALGERLAASKADAVFLFGEETKVSCEKLRNAKGKFAFHTNDIDELKSKLTGCVKKGDMILLKGSRSCALERVLP